MFYDSTGLRNPAFNAFSFYPQTTASQPVLTYQLLDPRLIYQVQSARQSFVDQLTLTAKPQKGHFSVLSAGKEFLKGVVHPLKAMVRHPLKTLGALAATVILASIAPITIPLMVILGLGTGLYQTVRGVGRAVSSYQSGDFESAEKAFASIGEGVFAFATSALGARSGGAIAAEAKASTSAFKAATTSAEKIEALNAGIDAAVQVKQGSLLNALKENGTLLTSRDGFKAVFTQLNPKTIVSALVTRSKEAVRMFKTPPVAQIEEIVQAAQQHLGIADKDMPKIVKNLVQVRDEKSVDLTGQAFGFYDPAPHQLHVEPDGFKFIKGLFRAPKLQAFLDKLPGPVRNFLGNWIQKKFPMDNAIPHELTHARQAAQIQQLTKAQATAAIEKAFPDLSVSERMKVLNELRFSPSNKGLSAQSLDDARQALIGYFKAARGFSEMRTEGLRPYIASPAEIEARQEAARFSMNNALKILDKAETHSSGKVLTAIRNLRKGVIELRLNQHLETLNRLAAENAPLEQIKAEETALQATRQLFASANQTRNMLGQERLANRILGIR